MTGNTVGIDQVGLQRELKRAVRYGGESLALEHVRCVSVSGIDINCGIQDTRFI